MQISKSTLIGVAAMILLIAAAYSRAPFNGKIWDDDFYLTAKHLATFEGLKRMWQEPTSTAHPYYPLTRTTFWIETQLWGENVFAHHVVSILIHILNSLLLWGILRTLNLPGAWVAATIFGVHPVTVESAAWIAERKNVLGVFFFLASMMAYLRFRRLGSDGVPGSREIYYLSLALFLFSLLSKTAFCMLPVALLLTAWWKEGRIRGLDVRLSFPFFLLAGILGALTIYVEKHHTGAQGPAFELNFLERILIAGRAFWFYIGKILYPHDLNFMYPRWNIDIADWVAYLYPVAAAALVLALWYGRKRFGRGPLFGVLIFVVTLLPGIGFINHFLMRYTFVADHLQYLPMTGILVLLVVLLYRFTSRLPMAAHISIWGLSIAVLCVLTWRYTGAYKDNFTLYNDIIRKNSTCFMAFNNRGLIHLERGQRELAIRDFDRAIQINPNFEEALVSRGHFYFQSGRMEEAIRDFDSAIKVNPAFSDAYRNRGAVLFAQRKYNRALADFNRAIYLDPGSSRAYNARGAVLSVGKRFDLALADYNRAIQLDPAYVAAYRNRSRMYKEIGNHKQATADENRVRLLLRNQPPR